MENSAKVQYKLKRKKGQKNVYLRIQPDGQLLVTSGLSVSEDYINSLVERKWEWYQKQIKNKGLNHNYKDSDRFTLLGEPLTLEVIIDSGKNSCMIMGRRLILMLRNAEVSDKTRQQLIKAEYAKALTDFLEKRIPYWAEKMGQKSKISLRLNNGVRQWASCSASKELCFSLKSASLKPALIDYLIVHELAHTFYMNHSASFWALVEKTLPDYKDRKSSLSDQYFNSFI